MKQTAINEFRDGLNLDLHPLVTPKTVLTDNLNGTFITYNGNEFCLQNDKGNKFVASLTNGYTPIGIKEHNGVLYIVSVNGNKTEIGTYPSLKEPISLLDKDFYKEYEFENNYKALRIGEGHSKFTGVDLGYTIESPITIEIQNSYDGTVNLILVADGKHTKIINSGFSKKSETIGEWIKRNQTADTNIYHITDTDKLNQEINLIRTSNVLTNVNLLGVQSGGQFKGGNYTFYIKFGDADYNQTDVVAESGIVSIFNGNDCVPSTISGTLADERTDKMINIRIIGLNNVYSKIYIYYSREYSDTQGFRMTEYGMFSEPIDMDYDENRTDPTWDNATYQDVWLTGFEQTVSINSEELNVDYHTIDWARAEAQHSNMLFLGNVGSKETFELYDRLREKSKQITAECDQYEQVGFVKNDYTLVENSENEGEYYSVSNIYNRVGYYPGEIYRFGIVYILKDGSKTPVFDVPGWNFQKPTLDAGGGKKGYEEIGKGVCLMPDFNVLNQDEDTNDCIITPIRLIFHMPVSLNEPDVLGWFIVRQKRIPNVICEGLSIATDKISNTPMMWNGEQWITQSFLSNPRTDDYNKSDALLNYSAILTDVNPAAGASNFSDWLGIMNYNYTSKYWNRKNYESDLFRVPSTFEWDESWTDEVAIKNAITAAISVNPNYENRQYVICTSFSQTISTGDEENDLATQLTIVKRDSGFTLRWFRKYRLTDTSAGKPTDTTTDEYAVQIAPEDGHTWIIADADDSIGDNVDATSTSNMDLYNKWMDEYESSVSTGTLNLKFIENPIKNSSVDNVDNFGKESNSLLSLDPCVNSTVASKLDGSKYCVKLERTCPTVDCKDNKGLYKNTFRVEYKVLEDDLEDDNKNIIENKCVFIPSNTIVKVVDNYEFSNVAGNAADVSKYKAFSIPYFGGNFIERNFYHSTDILNKITNLLKKEDLKDIYNDLYSSNKNINLLRGLFTPYIGITNNDKIPFGIYSIKLKETLDSNDFLVRQQDNSEYYAVSKYTDSQMITVFRGDCYTNTVSMRMIRNFVDATAPAAEIIVDPKGWQKWVVDKDKDATEEKDKPNYSEVNLSDVNTVDLGYWVTFKCLSSYNLGLRAKDPFHVDEMALLGSERSFYPLNGASTSTGNKIEESFLLNDGLSASVGRKRYNLLPNDPYTKSEFSNRIMFSNVNVTDAFTNGYRTFQGLSYKDYDKQYGAITKLLSLGQNIFVVMEHGLGLVPVNPKALMQTTTGEAIHIYGYGVLPDEMTIISQDYGSKYEHSIIRTPIGIYGIDVDAKKIWRFSDKQGFETISDMKIETYLKDYLEPLVIEMGSKDIRTHYNGKKGDLMFTWNSKNGNELYSICYNERQNIWTTRYDWKPIVSENINDEFYSLNFGSKFKSNEHPEYKYEQNQCSIWDHASDVGYDNAYVSQWYDKEHGFEFEFVVSDPVGVNKIFDNLQIISNNVQPDEMEITVIGDDYEFKRDLTDLEEVHKERAEYDDVQKIKTTSNTHGNNTYCSDSWTYKFDHRLNQKAIVNIQELKDIYKFGRRIGNIQYKEGSWFTQIEPLRMNIVGLQQKKEIRIRDKWAKIRIRYSGKDLAVITAIKTLINI